MTFVYDFDHEHEMAWDPLKLVLGGKGAGLNRMARDPELQELVPPGFTITTDAYRHFASSGLSDQLISEVRAALDRLEERTQSSLGDPASPLLVSVRGGAPVSMPGQLETVLNVGFSGKVFEYLAKQEPEWAFDSHRVFLEGYARAASNISRQRLLDISKGATGKNSESDWNFDNLRAVNLCYASLLAKEGINLEADNHWQILLELIQRVFASWDSEQARRYRSNPRERIPDHLGTAVNVQCMVFGNRDSESGSGILLTRDKDSGAHESRVDFATGCQGDAIVSGTVDPVLDGVPKLQELGIWERLLAAGNKLEEILTDACDIEFTVEGGRLWILQVRPAARSGQAALRIAIDLATEPHASGIPLRSMEDTLLRLDPDDVRRVLYDRLRPSRDDVFLAQGETGAFGAAKGQAVFSVRAAETATVPVILIRPETVPEDTAGMFHANGYVTVTGGRFSHAALVATKWGRPAVIGVRDLQIDEAGGRCYFTLPSGETRTVYAGEPVSIDGFTGEIYCGDVQIEEAKDPTADLRQICAWASEVCERERQGNPGELATVAVRVNAERAQDVTQAVGLGAQGVGMVRTERMPTVSRALNRNSTSIFESRNALLPEVRADLRQAHYADFRELISVCRSMECPLAIRLLDTALADDLRIVRAAQRTSTLADPTSEEEDPGRAARDVTAMLARGGSPSDALREETWRSGHSVGALSTRGVRLGLLVEDLYRLQLDALMDAIIEQLVEGYLPRIELIIPMVIAGGEIELVRSMIDQSRASLVQRLRRDHPACARLAEGWHPSVGVMLETPRAMMISHDLAPLVDFFTIGTNDLTQMVYGFDREEVGGPLLNTYFKREILATNPFDTIDEAAVLPLVEISVNGIRTADEGQNYHEIGVSGDHGGDATSIKAFAAAGIDYVSCRADRVPVALLSAAQHAIARKRSRLERDARAAIIDLSRPAESTEMSRPRQ